MISTVIVKYRQGVFPKKTLLVGQTSYRVHHGRNESTLHQTDSNFIHRGNMNNIRVNK